MPPRKKKAAETVKETAKTATETLTKAKPKAAAKPAAKKAVKAKKAEAPAAVKTVETLKAAEKTFNPNCYVIVDHPVEGEVISGLHYAIRIGASECGAAEIAFDGGDWQPCRQAAGYWWFDWGYFTPGQHTIVARLRDAQGNTICKSTPVNCQVI